MKQDRFLIGILVGIGLLIIVAVGAFFVRQGSYDYVADTTPDNVVHNFLYAIHQEEYERAYGYLADREGKPSLTEFRSQLSQGNTRYSSAVIRIVSYDILENEDGSRESVVELEIDHISRGPFDTGYNSSDVAILVEQDGQWKINEMPYWLGGIWYPERYP